MDDPTQSLAAGRRARMEDLWRRAHDDVAFVHGDEGPVWGEVFRYAPGLADRVGWAEREAEEASMVWAAGSEGEEEIQMAIVAWRDLWIEAINLVRDSRVN